MNRSQAINTIMKDDWQEFRDNEIALDRAMEYVLEGRL